MKNKEFCCGCSACLNICPKNAISMVDDEYGFVFPSIDKEKCVNCGLCDKVCDRIDTLYKTYPLKAFAISSKNTELSQKSSSGGMFAELAKSVLSNGGVVFGCVMEKIDEKFVIKHISVDKENDLSKLQGSKYVQSDIGNSYFEAKKYLDKNLKVLFSGTPCQIAGLQAFLNKAYNNLITVDLSCTGVPSQKLFNDYIKFLENKSKTIIKNFKFRDKLLNGWTCNKYVFYDEKEKIHKVNGVSSAYHNLFLHNLITRNSCKTCNFSSMNRVSDITIADCWGVEQVYPELLKGNNGVFDKNNGVSLVLINSPKGEDIFKLISSNIIFREVDAEKLKNYNGPLKERNLRNNSVEYLEEYRLNGYVGLDKLFKKRRGISKRIYYFVLQFVPNFVKNFYKRITR